MTKIFLDSSDMKDITRWIHLVDGVTTSPSMLRKKEEDLEEIAKVADPLPLFVVSGRGYYSEARKIQNWLGGVNCSLAVTVPFLDSKGSDTLEIVDTLTKEGVRVNCAAIASLSQVVLAASVGSRYISVSVGGIEDEGGDYKEVVRNSQDYISETRCEDYIDPCCELVVESVHTVGNVLDCIKVGVDIITIPSGILQRMTQHQYSKFASQQFEDDYIPVEIQKGLVGVLLQTAR